MRINDIRRGTFAQNTSANATGQDAATNTDKNTDKNTDVVKLGGITAAIDDFIKTLDGSSENPEPIKFVDKDSTKEEYMAALRGFSAEYLYQYDSNYGNNDGVLTKDEHEKAIFGINVAVATQRGDINKSGAVTEEDTAALNSIQNVAHLYTEALDLDNDGIISVEEEAALYAYSDKCIVDGVEDDPQGTITPEAAATVDNYVMGMYLPQSDIFNKYLYGSTLDSNEQESFAKGIQEIRNNNKSVGEDLGIDFSKQSTYFDVFNE